MYYAIICRLKNIRKHPNADRLQLVTLFGNQVVVGMDSYDGELGIYFPTDGQLSQEYSEANNLVRKIDPETGENKGGLFDENRRVRAQCLRGEKSDGFFMPISSLEFTGANIYSLEEGFQFDSIAGIEICRKYVSVSTKQGRTSSKENGKGKKRKSKNIMFKEHFDTNQWAYNSFKVPLHSVLYITEKVHGTSARISHCKETLELTWWQKILNRLHPLKNEKWIDLSGSRRRELHNFEDGGYYKNGDFRKQWHDFLSGNLRKGETIYFEIVGWSDENKTIMTCCDNKKLQNKEFLKRYGNTTTFSYGCTQGKSDIYVYRITMTNEDGHSVEYPWSKVKERCKELGIKTVPELCCPIFLSWEDGEENARKELGRLVDTLTEGPSTIDPSHIREGVVVRCENFGDEIYCLKHKSFEFKCIEGIIKDTDVLDIEEAEDIAA